MEFNTKFDAKAIENEVRSYLGNLDLKAHLENELAGKELVGYIEGPPTMNGEPHAGSRCKQRQVGAGLGETVEVRLAKRVSDGDAYFLPAQRRQQ